MSQQSGLLIIRTSLKLHVARCACMHVGTCTWQCALRIIIRSIIWWCKIWSLRGRTTWGPGRALDSVLHNDVLCNIDVVPRWRQIQCLPQPCHDTANTPTQAARLVGCLQRRWEIPPRTGRWGVRHGRFDLCRGPALSGSLRMRHGCVAPSEGELNSASSQARAQVRSARVMWHCARVAAEAWAAGPAAPAAA